MNDGFSNYLVRVFDDSAHKACSTLQLLLAFSVDPQQAVVHSSESWELCGNAV